MENFPDFEKAVWYKLTKDRTTQLIPVFTDYGVSTSIGATLYDKDMVPSRLVSELIPQALGDTRAWYLSLDFEEIASLQAAGITVPTDIETADSLAQLRAMFNRKQTH